MATPSAFVNSNEVIATAMSVLEGADTIDRAFLKQWVYLGLQEIGPNTAWYDEATLYPVEHVLRKPSDMHSPIDLALFDSGNHEIKYTLRGKGNRIHEEDSSTIYYNSSVDLSEDAYYFHIGTQSASNLVSHAILKYWKFPVDEAGDLLVPETDSLPLVLFIRYMWAMRKDDKQGINQAYPMWRQALREARSAHKIPSILEGAEIARTWSSMIQKQRFKQF